MKATIEMYKEIAGLSKAETQEDIPDNLSDQLKIFNLAQTQRVEKPWGFEIWISDGTECPYAFKIIGLKKGKKTSLQYHKKKSEHNFILSGQALLHYEDKISGAVTTSGVLTTGCVIRVLPPAIHRIEALTDLILIEASSPELDDVFRIQDDTNRPHGRIAAEHR